MKEENMANPRLLKPDIRVTRRGNACRKKYSMILNIADAASVA